MRQFFKQYPWYYKAFIKPSPFINFFQLNHSISQELQIQKNTICIKNLRQNVYLLINLNTGFTSNKTPLDSLQFSSFMRKGKSPAKRSTASRPSFSHAHKSTHSHSHHHHKSSFGHRRTGHTRYHSRHPLYARSSHKKNSAREFEVVMDNIAARTGQPQFFNGTLFISGGERKVINQLDNFSAIQPQFYQDPYSDMNSTMGMMDPSMMPGMMPQLNANNNPLNTMANEPFMQESLPGNMVPMEQMTIDPSFLNANGGYPPSQPQMMMPQPMMMAPQPMVMPTSFAKVDITVVGNKTTPYNCFCYTITYLLGACLIFPLCFMCCMWWKKMVYPKYELNIEFYRCIGRYLRSNPFCIHLQLTVCDNAFDLNKARALYESLQGTSVQNFQFVNRALCCNHNGSEVDEFVANMTAIKSLPMQSKIKWNTMIL